MSQKKSEIRNPKSERNLQPGSAAEPNDGYQHGRSVEGQNVKRKT
jgi:hypothetical protein